MSGASEVRGPHTPDLLATCRKFYSAMLILDDGPDDSDRDQAIGLIVEAMDETRAALDAAGVAR